MSNDTFQISFKVVKPLPVKEISNWEDKVVYGIARTTLDFTNSKKAFPWRTGTLNLASMAAGVSKFGEASYGLGYSKEYNGVSVNYGKKVYEYPQSTNWSRSSTIAHWYKGVYDRYRNEINQVALKGAEGELK